MRAYSLRTVSEALDTAFGPGLLQWHVPDVHAFVESMLLEEKMGRVVKGSSKEKIEDIIVQYIYVPLSYNS